MRENRPLQRYLGWFGLTLSLVMVLSAGLLAQNLPRPPGRTASLNGIEMYYEIQGAGPPLILLHGFSGSGRFWKLFVADFAKHYQVIVPDLRGHGRSTNLTSPFTFRQSALDIYALLDHLGISQFKGAGLSAGGITLLHMATQQPPRVESMILIGAASYFPEEARKIMQKATVESLTPQQWERLRQDHDNDDDQIRALRRQYHNFKESYEDVNFTPPYLSTMTAKTLIVHGDRDEHFPVSIPLEMYRSIPSSYLWVVPNGVHVAITEQESDFTRTALEFLGGAWDKKEATKSRP